MHRILAEAGDASAFPTAAHLASYAGLTPTTRRSGTSVRGEGPPRGSNKTLKRALFLTSFASLSSPESRTYYDRKRAENKRLNAALICLSTIKFFGSGEDLVTGPATPGHPDTMSGV